MLIAVLVHNVGKLVGKQTRLNPFNVKMLTIHRYFDIANIRRDLGYEPLVRFEEGWPQTVDWFKENWCPQNAPPSNL